MTSELTGPVGSQAIKPRISGSPEWLESTLNVTPGRDPLGFQTITTDRIIPQLVPGVLALSRRARYISFYAFLIDDYRRRQLGASNNSLSTFIKRREYELALAVELCPVGHSGEAVASNGRQRAGPAVSRGDAVFTRNESVDSYLGGYGLYYKSPMIDLGLVAPRGTSIGESGAATPVDVLWPNEARAEALAGSFRSAIADTEYFAHYFASDRDIPREVLVDYARVACLCRLGEFRGEQLALRDALLVPSPAQPAQDVTRRREAFAFLLWLADQDERVVRSDESYRERIWDAHEQRLTGTSETLRKTGARWGALIAKEFAQEGISSIWARVCATGLAANGANGIAAADLDDQLIEHLVVPGALEPFGRSIAVGPEMPTTQLRAEVVSAAAGHSLEELHGWALKDGSALAGLALILAVDARISAMGKQPSGWSETADQDGERQPGLTHLRHWISGHLSANPDLRTTMRWAVRTLVLWPHELIAYSKLPESTFRFRWESGRLRFYDLRPERFLLTDIRRDALGRLAADVGLLEWTQTGAVPTADGRAFVAEVFS